MSAHRAPSPLLGAPDPAASDGTEQVWRVAVSTERLPYLADHSLGGSAVLPGSVHVEFAVAAAAAAFGTSGPGGLCLEDVSFERVCFVPARPDKVLEVRLLSDSGTSAHFVIGGPAAPDRRPVRYAAGRLRLAAAEPRADPPAPASPLADPPGPSTTGDDCYTRLASAGNHYGPAFRAVARVWAAGGSATALLAPPPLTGAGSGDHLAHPVVLDAGLQVLALAAGRRDATFVLAGIATLRLHGPLDGTRWVRARLREPAQDGQDDLVGDVELLDPTGRVTADLGGVRLRCLPTSPHGEADGHPAPVPVVIAASFTADPMADVLAFWGDTLGLALQVGFAPAAQLFHQLLDPASLLAQNRSGLNVVLLRVEDLLHPVARPLRLPQDRASDAAARPTLPGVGEIRQLHAHETEFLYDEIFVREAYLGGGVELHDGDVVLDVGANIGMFTLFVHSRCTHPRVYAFEPSATAFDALASNVERHCPGTTVFNCGLSDTDGTAAFTDYPNSTLFSGFDAEPGRDRHVVETVIRNVLREQLGPAPGALEQMVASAVHDRLDARVSWRPTRTLSSVLTEQRIDRVDLLKIDVEGGELRVLAGLREEQWHLVRQVVVEVHERAGVDAAAVVALLRSRGFDVSVRPGGPLLDDTGFCTVLARRPTGPVPEQDRVAARLGRDVDALAAGVRDLQQRTGGLCTVAVCPSSPDSAADPALAPLIAHAEEQLAGQLRGAPGLTVLTPDDLSRHYPVPDHWDARGAALAGQPYTSRFLVALATLVVRRHVAAAYPSPVKAIAVDCDDTLWSGRCGEDGPAGVELTEPALALQAFLVDQAGAGRLLGLCSANHDADVRAVFAHHRQMPLRWEQLTTWRLNWAPKSDNIASMADELGLALSSFALLDDDPVQGAEVAAHCPDVLVLPLPPPAEVPRFLAHLWAFDQHEVTEDDRRRALRYQQQRQRQTAREASPTLAEFLAGLEQRIEIRACRAADVPRVAQLTRRTTQFTTSGQVWTTAALGSALATGQVEGLAVEVADRFGDYGLVGAMLFHPAAGTLRVPSLVLSCRALGRGVEHAMVARLGRLAAERELSAVDILAVPTVRNEPARQFLAALPTVGPPQTAAGADGWPSPGPAGVVHRLLPGPASRTTFFPPTAAVPAAPAPSGAAPHPQVRALPTGVYRRIATELNDVDAIAGAVQSWRLRGRPSTPQTYRAPVHDDERVLAAVWQRVLGLTTVGTEDNFFDAGGTSVRALQLVTEVAEATGVELAIVDVFDHPTVREMATLLHADGGDTRWERRRAARAGRGLRRREAQHGVRDARSAP